MLEHGGSAELHEPGMSLLLFFPRNRRLSSPEPGTLGIHPRSRPAEMDFLNDRLIFTQSDMDRSNFALDKDNRICMFDFAEVGVLPESFASYTLGCSSDPFIKSVAGYLGWIDRRNRYSMARARAALWTSSVPTHGTFATT